MSKAKTRTTSDIEALVQDAVKEQQTQDQEARRPEIPAPSAASPLPVAPASPLRDLVLALDRAERDPHVSFVSLKWFRDKRLPEPGGSWAASTDARQDAIAKAIQNRWLLTSKVPNPKTPEFPLTAIRLNRLHPQVQEMLSSAAPDFDPIPMRGEPLSETILRERR